MEQTGAVSRTLTLCAVMVTILNPTHNIICFQLHAIVKYAASFLDGILHGSNDISQHQIYVHKVCTYIYM